MNHISITKLLLLFVTANNVTTMTAAAKKRCRALGDGSKCNPGEYMDQTKSDRYTCCPCEKCPDGFARNELTIDTCKTKATCIECQAMDIPHYVSNGKCERCRQCDNEGRETKIKCTKDRNSVCADTCIDKSKTYSEVVGVCENNNNNQVNPKTTIITTTTTMAARSTTDNTRNIVNEPHSMAVQHDSSSSLNDQPSSLAVQHHSSGSGNALTVLVIVVGLAIVAVVVLGVVMLLMIYVKNRDSNSHQTSRNNTQDEEEHAEVAIPLTQSPHHHVYEYLDIEEGKYRNQTTGNGGSEPTGLPNINMETNLDGGNTGSNIGDVHNRTHVDSAFNIPPPLPDRNSASDTDLKKPIESGQSQHHSETREQPIDNVRQPIDSVKQPKNNLKEHIYQVGQPVNIAIQHINNVDNFRKSVDNCRQSKANVRQTTDNVIQPIDNVKQSIDTVSTPLAIVRQPLETVRQPVKSVRQPTENEDLSCQKKQNTGGSHHKKGHFRSLSAGSVYKKIPCVKWHREKQAGKHMNIEHLYHNQQVL